MKKNIHSILIISCVMVISLTVYGCSSSKTKQTSAPVSSNTISANQPADNSTSANLVSNNSLETETTPITITVVNLSKTEVGSFSVFDPQLNKQIDSNQIASDGTLSVSYNWPINVKDLQWAVYDTQGNVLLESSTDITECKELVSILLSGEDTIDDVDVFLN